MLKNFGTILYKTERIKCTPIALIKQCFMLYKPL